MPLLISVHSSSSNTPDQLSVHIFVPLLIIPDKMRFLALSIVLLIGAVLNVLAEEELRIDVTTAVECERKTQKGDRINVHYRGSLQKDGTEFDASYNRGQPLTFAVGQGSVIKGYVVTHPILYVCVDD